jgi:hypothetical protein
MLTYGTQYDPPAAASEYINDKINPSFWQSTKAGFAEGFSTPFVALSDLGSFFSGAQPDAEAKDLAVSNKAFGEIADSGHPVGAFLGNTLGTILNPLSLALGEGIGSAVAKSTESILGALAPSIGAKLLTPSLTGAKVASHMTRGAAEGSAFSLAPSVVDNYDNSSTKLNWAGVAKETAIGGALGLGVGALPFAYGLIRYRLANKLPVTAAEKAFAEKDLANHVTKDLNENLDKANEAQQIVKKYVNNDSVTVDQGYVNAKLLEETDLSAMQSSIADMLSSKGDVDSKMLSNVLTPGLRPLLDDDQVMGGLTEAKKHIDSLHTQTQENLLNTLQKRLPKIATTFKDVFKLSDGQMKTLLENPKLKKLLQIMNDNKNNAKEIVRKLQDSNRFGKRTAQHAAEIELALDTLDKLSHYNRALNTVDVLNNLKSTAPEDSEIVQDTQNYLNGRVTDSAPLPRIEKEVDGTTTSQQKIERQVATKPDESVSPEQLPRDAEGLANPIRDTQKALKSLKKNNKVLSNLMSCITGEK